MRERPMLYSTPMVQSILANRKTKTRRVFSEDLIINERPDDFELIRVGEFDCGPDKIFGAAFLDKSDNIFVEPIKCPYGKPGDLLWVRESFTTPTLLDGCEEHFYYKAGPHELIHQLHRGCNPKWRPSIHMPKAAARIWLQITDIKVERLHSISKNDAIEEGIQRETLRELGNFLMEVPSPDLEAKLLTECYYFYPCEDLRDDSYVDDPKVSFISLWASINGWESWNANPWVWVISFKVISTTGKPKNIQDKSGSSNSTTSKKTEVVGTGASSLKSSLSGDEKQELVEGTRQLPRDDEDDVFDPDPLEDDEQEVSHA